MKLALQILRHPLRALGILVFLAALEGMFGSPTGAARMLNLAGIALTFAIIGGGAWLVYALVVAFGPPVIFVMAIGLVAFWIIGYCARHLRWEA